MKTICSGCSTVIRDAAPDNRTEEVITHGICDECADLLLWPHRPSLQKFLDALDAPVLVSDPQVSVIGANRKALELLGKELPEIEGLPAGNVFECTFARLPEGCGKTLHCDGCTIRRTVTDTFQTGRSHLKVPAGLSRGTTDSYDEIQCQISTEKIDDVVMLRIDTIGDDGESSG